MSRLDYIHDTLYWDDKPVNDLEQLEAYEQVQKDVKDEIDAYRNSMKKLINDSDITKQDLLEDFIDVLQSFIE